MTLYNSPPVVCDACVPMYPVEKWRGEFYKTCSKIETEFTWDTKGRKGGVRVLQWNFKVICFERY